MTTTQMVEQDNMQQEEIHNSQRKSNIVRIDAALKVDKYIGQPYWPERNLLIEIGKSVHPKLGDAKKQQARTAVLQKMDKSIEDYDRAVIRAARPFYTIDDTNPDLGDGEIIIPSRHFLAFLNHASMEAPRVIPKINNKGMTFIGIKFFGPVEGFTTGLTVADAKLFSRFVKMAESNQRSFAETPYISGFVAQATLSVDTEVLKSNDLLKLVEWGGKWIGIGSARPQGYGRFAVADWTVR